MNLPKGNGVAVKSNNALVVVRMPNETAESMLAWREIMTRPNLSGTHLGFFSRPGTGARMPSCPRKP